MHDKIGQGDIITAKAAACTAAGSGRDKDELYGGGRFDVAAVARAVKSNYF